MTIEEKAIINIHRRNAQLEQEIENLQSQISKANRELDKVGVPFDVEDGNSIDDLDFDERVAILCKMYLRIKENKTKP